jgi:hypothetical protein
MALEKHIKLSDKAEKILTKVQEEQGFSSVNKTLEFIITDYENNRNLADNVSQKVSEDLSKVLTRIRLGSNTADINSQIIIEMLNAIIYQFNVAPMTTQFGETTAVTVSRQCIKDKIAAFKQKKDNKAGK